MFTSRVNRPVSLSLFALAVLCVIGVLESSSPPSAPVVASTPDSAEEIHDNDTLDAGGFAASTPDTGLAALFIPIPDTGAELKFDPVEIDDGVLTEPPKRFDEFNLDAD